MNPTERLRCDQSPNWLRLQEHYAAHFAPTLPPQNGFDLRRAFAQQPQRARDMTILAPAIVADLSKNLIDAKALDCLNDLAHDCGVLAHRDAMLHGDPINVTEAQGALHAWLRAPKGSALVPEAMQGEHERFLRYKQEMLDFAQAVRDNASITDVVHIGIGGSDLGPRLVTEALASSNLLAPQSDGPRVHFVANMDARDLLLTLRPLQAERTLVILASKSFGTAETLANAHAALQWARAGDPHNVHERFVALTAKPQAAAQLGIQRCLTLPDGIGGRYSLWSVIGLPIAIALGPLVFERLLAGAHAMDEHFAQSPQRANLPIQLALIDLWYRNFLGMHSRCLTPYHCGLRLLPAWLQQLEMESNGKSCDMQGQPLHFATAPIIWGEQGSNCQHSFFQLLHQGRENVAVEFIAVVQSGHALHEQHRQLLANALAQSRALMTGQNHSDPAKRCPGNRPSTFLLLEQLDAFSLGSLLSLYEHRTFVAGSLWGVDSFDQWGVELGKTIARELLAQWSSPDAEKLDASTIALMARMQA